MSKIEEMARAIYEGRNGAGAKPWSLLPISHKAPYVADARFGLRAILEPSESMTRAAQLRDASGEGDSIYAGIFRAMISAILEGK